MIKINGYSEIGHMSGYTVTIQASEKVNELFKEIREKLKFPYFGDNWNALRDCLCDLSWLNVEQVNLVQEGIPLANNTEDLQMYIRVLLEASERVEQIKFPPLKKLNIIVSRELIETAFNDRLI